VLLKLEYAALVLFVLAEILVRQRCLAVLLANEVSERCAEVLCWISELYSVIKWKDIIMTSGKQPAGIR